MRFQGLSWYCSPAGGWRGDGSRGRPWSLEKALGHPPEVQPGDVIWMLGGSYRPSNPLVSRLEGAPEAPIVLRGDPDSGLASVDTALTGAEFGLRILGAHTHFVDFELRWSGDERWSDVAGGEGNPRGVGVLGESGLGVKLVELIVRDFGLSLFESRQSGIEIHGCLFFNSYWDGPDRSHGPGLYVRNPLGSPRKAIVDNVVFQHGRQGLQGFGSQPFAHVTVEGNVFFNNGIARDGFHRNLMFGNGGDDHAGVVIRDNLAYLAPGPPLGHEHNLLGGVGGSHGLEVTGNWLVHPGREALKLQRADNPRVEGNRIVGGVTYSDFETGQELAGAAVEAQFPNNDYFEVAPAQGWWVWLRESSSRPNEWEGQRRVTVAVLNWSEASEAEVDLSDWEAGGGLVEGAQVRVRSVQEPGDWRTLIYEGGRLKIPMDGWGVAAPVGRDIVAAPLPATLPKFGVFQAEWAQPGWSAEPREPEPTHDPGAGLPEGSQREARIQAWRTDDALARQEQLAQRRRAWRAGKTGRTVSASPVQLIFASLTEAERFRAELEITGYVEGGVGPVRIGVPFKLADGRAVIAHRLEAVDADWVRAVTGGFEVEVGGMS